MSEQSPFDARPDAELGTMLREALAAPHDGAFVTRVRARLGRHGWEDELSRWFWQGLAAASLATLLAGWGFVSQMMDTDSEDTTVASELLDGQQPGADILLTSLLTAESQ